MCFTAKLHRPTSYRQPEQLQSRHLKATPDLVSRALDILAGADRPLILAGSGAWWSDASGDLEEFVEPHSAFPFYTTPISRGLVPEDHALSFPAARSTAFRETDAVLVVGTRFNWIMTFGRRIAANAKVIQVDIHAEGDRA